MRPDSTAETAGNELDPEAVRLQVERIAGSTTFANATVLRRFLQHIVAQTLSGKTDQLKEYALGVDVFERSTSFDPRIDSIVRVQANRLRSKLEDYYRAEGENDDILIELPKGRYAPTFRRAHPELHARRSSDTANAATRKLDEAAETRKVNVKPEVKAESQRPDAVALHGQPLRDRHRPTLILVATLLVMAFAGILASSRLSSSRAVADPVPGFPETTLTTIVASAPLPENTVVDPGLHPARSGGVAVSPDGRQIAVVGRTGNNRQILVRSIDSAVFRAVPGTMNASDPSWSPDGRHLAFMQDWKLKQIRVDGGVPEVIVDVVNTRSAAAWGVDGTLLFHAYYRGPLLRISASGGPVSTLLPESTTASWFSPVWLPDRRRFLVVRFVYSDDAAEKPGVYVGSVDSTEPVMLLPGRIAEVALGRGELFFRRGSELFAQPFNSETLELSGEAQIISDHASMAAAGGSTLVYFDPPGGLSQGHRITWFSRTGDVVSMTGQSGTFRDPRLSYDGSQLAVASAQHHGLFEIWTYDLSRNVEARLAGNSYIRPTWRRDGAILAHSPDGVRFFAPGHLTSERWSDTVATPMDTAADGTVLVRVDAVRPDPRLVTEPEWPTSRLAVLPPDGGGEPRRLGPREGVIDSASFSPDGKWVAYESFEALRTRVYVEPYPGPGPRQAVTGLTGGGGMTGGDPRWRGDGRELFYLEAVDGAPAIVSVPISYASGVPHFAVPRVLFKVPGMVSGNHSFDVTADGQRFVAIVQGDLDPSPLTIRVRAALPGSN